MKEFWSPRIRNSTPYIPGEQPRGRVFIKLNTNESPYPPSDRVLDAIRGAANETLRLYPDPECLILREAVAGRFGLQPEQVFAGNGSDEILAFCFQAFFDPEKTILFPDITYSFYPVYAGYFGLRSRTVALDEAFDLPAAQFYGSEGGVVIANPNAPTGKAVGLDAVRSILEHNPGVVVLVDEAYVDFGGQSAAGLIPEYRNLVVVHTLSKSSSLAGLRVGYAMGDANLMEALRCVRDSINSYTVDRLAQAGGAAALRDTVWFAETTRKIRNTREKTAERLRGLVFLVHNSSANFLFIHRDGYPAKNLLTDLRERGILVRWFDKPRISDYLRVSVGSDAEMDTLVDTLKELLNHHRLQENQT
jgi:histidinol-phosphate aminotransferase